MGQVSEEKTLVVQMERQDAIWMTIWRNGIPTRKGIKKKSKRERECENIVVQEQVLTYTLA